MLILLLGPDDFSKKQHIDSLIQQQGANLSVFSKDDELPALSKLGEGDLFSKPSAFLFEGVMPQLDDRLEQLIQSKNQIIISVTSLDKRKKENKDLLANKNIVVKEFYLPHGQAVNKWIENRVKELGAQISKPVVEELAVRLGRDNAKETKIAGKVVAREEIYNLWQADQEIKKLIVYAGSRQIEIEDVKDLVFENLEVDAFEIINAIGEGKKQQALNLIQEFLRVDVASDEKTAVIQLNGLLSDQMRSLAITHAFLKSRAADAEIIKRTGWKSGRLYIMKKIAARLPAPKILETMKKLEALDEELKTSQTPPKVLLDMIVAQIF